MWDTDAHPSSRDQRFNELVQAYRKAVEAGQTPDRHEWLRRYPDLASEVEALFGGKHGAGWPGGAAEAPTLAPGAPPPDAEAPTLAPEPMATDGTVEKVRNFGDYELLEEIARGGMGVVWRARHVRLNRVVALKMILAGQLASEADVKRFQSEAEAAANLDHPHIVPIYEVGAHDGQHYFSMKFIEGGSLAPRVADPVRDPKAAVRLLATVARAVHHAHQRGILHRDLKPGNILLDAEGQPHVTDFGLAKRVEGDQSQTRTGAIVGTPAYMPPEQARAEKRLTTAIDVYSLGAVLYEMLTGCPPFKSETHLDTILQVLERDPVRPCSINAQLDRDLETICLKCLEKEPARRYDSAAALADDLERWLRGEPIQARPATAWERVVKWTRRKPAAAALMGVIAAAALALIGVVVGFNLELRDSLAETKHQRDVADEQRVDADQQRRRAQEQEDLARQRESWARRIGYAADLNLAQQALESGNGIRLFLALERQIPPPGQQDLRTFEWDYLWRQAQTEHRTLTGHTQPPTMLAWSPDGKSLASASATEVKVWDVMAAQAHCTLSLPPRFSCTAVAFSHDGKLLATTATNYETKENLPGQPQAQIPVLRSLVQLWDAATGRKVADLKEGRGIVHVLAFGADDRTLMAAGPSAPDLNVFENPDRMLWELARGSNFASPNCVWTWDLRTGQGTKTPVGFPGWMPTPTGMALAPDGQTLAVNVMGIPIAQIAKDWIGLLVFRIPRGSLWNPFARMENFVGVWDIPGAIPLKIVRGHGNNTFAYGSVAYDGHTAVWSTQGGELVVRNVQTHQEQTGPPELAGYGVVFALSPDGQNLAWSSTGGTVKLWNLAAKRQTAMLFGHRQAVRCLSFSPDGRSLAAGGDDKTVKLWPARGRREPVVISLEKGERPMLRVCPDGNTLLVTDQGDVKIWDFAKQKERRRLSSAAPSGERFTMHNAFLPFAPHAPIVSVALSPDGRLLAAKSYAGAQVWDLATGKSQASIPSKEIAGAVRFTPDGRFLMIGETFWAVDSWKQASEVPIKGLANVRAFSCDGKRWAAIESNPKENTARVIVRELGKDGAVFDQLLSNTVISRTEFSPDGGTLALVSDRHRVALWNVNTGKKEMELRGHTQSIGAIAFAPDGQTLATGSADRTVKLWDPITGQERMTMRYQDRQPVDLLFTPDGETLVVSWSGDPRQGSGGLPFLGSPGQNASPGVVTIHRAGPRAARPNHQPD